MGRKFRMVIKHPFIKGKLLQEINEKLGKYYYGFAPLVETVFMWFQIFWSGHMSTNDAEFSKRSVEILTPGINNKMYDLMLTNKRLKVHESSHAIGILSEEEQKVLHQYLSMKRLYT